MTAPPSFDPAAELVALRSPSRSCPGRDARRLRGGRPPEAINHEAKDEPAGARPRPGRLLATALWLREAFADLRVEVHEVVAERDLVAVHCTMSGRHASRRRYDADGGVEEAFPPTGKAFATTQTHWMRVADGKIIEHWANRDDLGMAEAARLGAADAAVPVRMALAKRRAQLSGG